MIGNSWKLSLGKHSAKDLEAINGRDEFLTFLDQVFTSFEDQKTILRSTILLSPYTIRYFTLQKKSKTLKDPVREELRETCTEDRLVYTDAAHGVGSQVPWLAARSIP